MIDDYSLKVKSYGFVLLYCLKVIHSELCTELHSHCIYILRWKRLEVKLHLLGLLLAQCLWRALHTWGTNTNCLTCYVSYQYRKLGTEGGQSKNVLVLVPELVLSWGWAPESSFKLQPMFTQSMTAELPCTGCSWASCWSTGGSPLVVWANSECCVITHVDILCCSKSAQCTCTHSIKHHCL